MSEEASKVSTILQKSYIISDLGKVDEFYRLYGNEFKQYNDRDIKVGDVIESSTRNLTVQLDVYRCPFCLQRFFDEVSATEHLALEKSRGHQLVTVNSVTSIFDNFYQVNTAYRLKRAKIYYEVIRPEEIIPVPESTEWKHEGDKHVPTPQERMKHDEDMAKWRKDMKETRGKRQAIIPIFSNGDIQLKGGSNWWYWCPQVWNNNQWVPMSVEQKDQGLETRVLTLLAIIPEEF